MMYRSKDFELARTDASDAITVSRTGEKLTLLPGELEQLFRFLGPLYEDVIESAMKGRLK